MIVSPMPRARRSSNSGVYLIPGKLLTDWKMPPLVSFTMDNSGGSVVKGWCVLVGGVVAQPDSKTKNAGKKKQALLFCHHK